MGITGDWDQRSSRRTLLKTRGSFAASVTVIGAVGTRAFATSPFAGEPFSLGIASGDATPNGMVLWTRLAPEPLVPGRRHRTDERRTAVPLDEVADGRGDVPRVIRRGDGRGRAPHARRTAPAGVEL